MVLLVLSCTAEKPAGTTNTQGPANSEKSNMPAATSTPGGTGSLLGSLELTPSDATRNSILNISAKGFSSSDMKIEWMVNGSPVSNSSGLQFKAAYIKKGDTVQVKATGQGREILSNIVRIGNSPPEVSTAVFAINDPAKPGELSVAVTGKDADGDEVSFLYEWTKNGQPAGTGKTVGFPMKRGDKVSVKIVPFDGEAYGRPVVLNSEIRNLPPVFAENSTLTFDGKTRTYQIKASDPDEDTLTYSLKEAPPGMTINPATGLVSWNVPSDFEGKTTFTACLQDGHGGETVKTFSIDIASGTKK